MRTLLLAASLWWPALLFAALIANKAAEFRDQQLQRSLPIELAAVDGQH